MEHFTVNLLAALNNKPGLTKERLALALNVEYDQAFRNALTEAHDAGLIHRSDSPV